MKCPYRIIKKCKPSDDGKEFCETQEFADCYGTECPLYIPEYGGNLPSCERTYNDAASARKGA